MSERTECPSVEQLKELAVGRLPDPPAGAFEEHLLSCDECAQKTAQLHQADTLVSAMRGAKSVAGGRTPEERARLDKMLGSLSGLRNGVVDATGLSHFEETHISGASARNDAEADLIEFLPVLRPAEAADELGRLGGFRLLKLLGHGGMGAVFLAEDVRLKRRVALKVLRPEFAKKKDATERFLREAQAAAAVRHDNVVTIFQVGEDNGTPFMAQELLQGESLSDRLHYEKSLPLDEVLRIGGQIADGLAAAHAHGLLHRDIKPANVWLERSRHAPRDVPNAPAASQMQLTSKEQSATSGHSAHHAERDGYVDTRVKILDFGLARLEQSDAHLTGSGMILGTPAYMSPEQASGETVDARTDLFSLGVVLYRMATGEQPFKGKDTLSVLKSLAVDVPQPPNQLRADIPQELSDFILRLLEKDRTRRPGSAVEVAGRMAALGRPSLKKNDARTAGRPRAAILQIALGFAAAVLFGVIVIKLKDKDGKETKITLDVPPGTKVVSVEQSPDSKPDQPAPENKPETAADGLPKPFITLGKLDAKQIPESERITGQPDELVAVIGEQRLRHWNFVRQIAVHPSGEFFMTRDDRGETRIWSTKTLDDVSGATDAAVRKRLNGSGGAPCFLPDGQSFWSGRVALSFKVGEDGVPKFTFLRERPLHKVTGYLPTVISPDGRWLAVVGLPQGILEIWDLAPPTPRLVKEISFPTKEYSTVLMLSRDGLRMMADGKGANPGDTNRLFLWDVDWSAEGGPKVTPFGEPIAAMHGSLFPDGQRVVSYTKNSPKFQVLDLRESPPRIEFDGEGHEPFAASPDGNWLASGRGSVTNLYHRAEGAWTKRFQLASAQSNLQTMTFSPDGKTLLVGDLGGRLHVWDLSVDPPVERLPAPPASRVTHLAFSPDGRNLAVQGWDGGTVWNVEAASPKRLEFTEAGHSPYLPPSFSEDSRLVAFLGGVWDLAQSPPKKSLDRSQAHLRLSSRGNTLATVRGYNDLEFFQWSLTDRGALKIEKSTTTWKPDRKPGSSVFGASGLTPLEFSCNRTVIDDGQGNVEVWNIEDDTKPLFALKHPSKPNGYRLSPAGELLFVWDNSMGAVWDLKTDPPTETRFRVTGQYTRDAFFTPDGQQIVTADDKGVAIYDWRQQREHRRLTFPGRVHSLAPHPDGQHLATANGNGTVYILRLPEHSQLQK